MNNVSAAEHTLDTTAMAARSQMLSPRFYRTDNAAVDRLDIAPIKREWDAIMREYEDDCNREHFRESFDFDPAALDAVPGLREEFMDFLVSSITAEYSGCVLYRDIEKSARNPEIAALMGYMARDESRHAGFINKALKQLGVAVDLGFLKREKKYTYFRPKFIYYATYLSEKIGYARYITIFRHLERHPDKRFHPIFNYFMEWCNDEFRHGESFALLMRANPHLLRGHNKLWIRFFILAVYATMYVRDHTRPAMYEAFGMDTTAFDFRVFDITTEISKQVFPITLNTDDARFRKGLERLRELNIRMEALRERGGLWAGLRRGGLALQAGAVFARLYCLPVNRHELPSEVRLAPAW